jgi:hypothetical protein
MENELIKHSEVVVSVRSGNCVRCKKNYEHSQNDICDRNKSEVQNFKMVIDKEGQFKNLIQRSEMGNIARNFDINNTTEGHNNHDLSLTNILPHNQFINFHHQSIRSLGNKANELLCHLHHGPPHIMCPTEHHLQHNELASLHIDNYTLGAHYCRKTKRKSGVCMFIHNSVTFTTLIIDNYCLDQDTEVCAIHLNAVYYQLCMVAVYRSPLCNLNTFQNNFGLILHKFFNLNFNFTVCYNIIINYLV